MNDIFLISDHHFGHANVIKMCNRPFSSVEEMNETMIDNWNKTVTKNDIVYHLGDIFWSQQAAYSILPRLNGKITFIYGNHDKSLKKIADKFPEHKYIEYVLELKDPVRMVLCHYPFASWNGAAHGVWHFHGHTHNNHILSDRHRVNVCVENINYTPVELYDIIDRQKKIMETTNLQE